MIISKLPLTTQQLNIAKEISKEFNLGIKTAKILVNRGINSLEKAQKFLHAGKENFLSPYLLSGVEIAKQKILSYVEQKKNILIFGDYDADGICATTIMYYTFKQLGVNVQTFIPERDLGYGITDKSIEIILSKQVDLIITVDCGISCKQEIEILKNNGIEVIVTDHHELPEELPNTTCINCKIPSEYPYNNLCGAGVAYKLSYALIGEKANDLLDFVAIATVADSMELTGENRDLVAEGLKLFFNPRPQIKALLDLGKNKEITSSMLAFSIAPKINACGRMGNAKLGLQLLISQNLEEISKVANQLNEYNIERQKECEKLYLSAKEKLLQEELISSVIVLYNEDWNGGLVGIVAAKIAEEYCRPTILFAKTEGSLKGSARSIDGVNLYQAIEACSKHLIGFGGHSQAAGVSIEEDKLRDFSQDLNEYINTHFSKKFVKEIQVEEIIEEPFTIQDGKDLNLLEPFGVGNKKPLFALKGNSFMVSRLSGEHITFKTNYVDMLYFNALSKAEELANKYTKTIVFDLNYSVYNGRESVKGFVKNYEVTLENNVKDKTLLFEGYLSDLLLEEKPCKNVKKEDIDQLIIKSLENPFGTTFILADIENLKHYPLLHHLPVEFSHPQDENLLNKIIVGATANLYYKNVIYLDNCIAKTSGIKCDEIKPFSSLNLSRDNVVKVFPIFNNYYKDLQDLLEKNPEENAFELIFAYKVLLELGIIKQTDYIKRDYSVKSSITNSIIYNKFQNR